MLLRRYGILFAVLALAQGTVISGDPAAANRDAIGKCLVNIANRAQEYYSKPGRLGGGEGSFATLGLSTLTAHPMISVGSFVLSSPTASYVTLTGTGVETGHDGATPIEIVVIVYTDSMAVTVTN